LSRSGSTVTAWVSATGATDSWVQVGPAVSFASSSLAGVIVCASSSALNTAAFDNVSIGGADPPPPPPPLPSPWQTQDIGAVAQPGSASFDSASGVFTVSGSGANIWGASDSFRYVYYPVSEDLELTTRVRQPVQNTSPYAKVGVMLRASTAAGAAHVVLSIRPNGSLEFMRRSSNGGQTTFLATGPTTYTPPTWLRLSRSGSTVTAWVSATGATGSWVQVGPAISFSSGTLAGLIVCASSSALNTATFDSFTGQPWDY
jgi:hypothetical protein